jgi:hypothetical protein
MAGKENVATAIKTGQKAADEALKAIQKGPEAAEAGKVPEKAKSM